MTVSNSEGSPDFPGSNSSSAILISWLQMPVVIQDIKSVNPFTLREMMVRAGISFSYLLQNKRQDIDRIRQGEQNNKYSTVTKEKRGVRDLSYHML